MYTALARFGYGLVKKIRPSKVKKFLKPGLDKASKAKFTGKAGAVEAKGIKLLKGGASKGYKGYRSLYGATLGSSAKRKVTSAATGGYLLGSFMSDD
tara:strand:+ start:228 stop:518 length:291 start_codon:yes stop_codon:yes gene_type:complete